MTNREHFLMQPSAENDDADYVGAISAAPESKLIDEQVICGYIKRCRINEIDCAECQLKWLDEEYI